MTDDAPDAFTDALGVYVGPASYTDVTRALDREGIAPGVVVLVRLEDATGALVWHRGGHLTTRLAGWSDPDPEDAAGEGYTERHVFVIGGKRASILGPLLAWADAPVVLDLHADQEGLGADAHRYSGGIRFRFYDGATLTIVFWHGVYHATQDGDLAPGFGPFGADAEADDP